MEKRGGVVELVIYEGDGHVLTKKEDEIDANKRIAAFLEKYVR